MNNPVLHLLGLSRKGGKIELGEEPVIALARAGRARVILVACDSADNSIRRAEHIAEQTKSPLMITPFTKSELGHALGRSVCAMVAISDFGLANAIAQHLVKLDEDKYGEAAEIIAHKAGRALDRQKEKARHEKKLKRQAQKPWVAPPKESGSKPKKKESTKQSAPMAKRPMPKGRITIQKKEGS